MSNAAVMDDLDRDLELDQLVAQQVMCDRPEIRWAASQDGGKSVALWTDNLITKAAVERFCQDHPSYELIRREVWPHYTGHVGLALQIVDKLRAAGIEVVIGCFRDGFSLELRQWRDRRGEGVSGDPHTGRSRVTFYARTGIDRLARGIAEAAAAPETIAAVNH